MTHPPPNSLSCSSPVSIANSFLTISCRVVEPIWMKSKLTLVLSSRPSGGWGLVNLLRKLDPPHEVLENSN